MFAYLIIFIISPLCLLIRNKLKNKLGKVFLLLIAILIPCFFAGVRKNNIGTDINVYVKYQYDIALKANSFLSYLAMAKIDKLYAIVSYFITVLFKNFNILLFFLQLIESLCFFCFLKIIDEKIEDFDTPLAYLIYLMIFFTRSLNLVRQHLAISLVFVSFALFIKKKKILSVVFIILAFLMHSTAIIGTVILGLYAFNESKFKEKRIIPCIIIVAICFLLIFFNNVISIISNIKLFASVATLKNVEYIKSEISIDIIDTFSKLLCLTIILVLKKNKFNINSYSFILTLLIIDFLTYEINIYITNGERLSLYFGNLAYILFLPQIKKCFRKDFHNQTIVNAIIIIYFCAYFYLKFMYQNAGAIFPYEWIF